MKTNDGGIVDEVMSFVSNEQCTVYRSECSAKYELCAEIEGR